MNTVRSRKIPSFLLRGIFLLLLLPMNILFLWLAYQKLTERFPSYLFGEAKNSAKEETFSAELKNGVSVSVKYSDQLTIVETQAGDRLLSIFDGENGLSFFRTNLDDTGTWFQDMLMIPSGNIAYHDSWFFDYNGDQQFDAMSDPGKGFFIRIKDKWGVCKLDKTRRTAAMMDGSTWKWGEMDWYKQNGDNGNNEENMADR